MFTSDDFYKDRQLWSDPRYYRCNSTVAIEEMWTQRGAIGKNGPASAAWGRCDSDYPREAVVSPYPFKTAQEHYEALKAETTKRGGPTKHTYATVPGDEWTGRYGRASTESWYQARKMQVSTMASLLTPKYQTYLVQEAYHSGNTNVAHWQSQYCWPEGFMRRWHQAAIRDHYITVTPQQVQIMTGIARNFVTNILIDREFDMSGATPRLGADVPRWYGETIGFWDKDTLITWTSNVIGWKVHADFEYSNKMQTIEIYSPFRDASGKFIGLNHEAIFYDEDALVEPIRIVRNFDKLGDLERRPAVHLHRLRADDLPDQRQGDAGDAGYHFRVRAARYVRPPVGLSLGKVLRAEHGAARRRGHLQLRVTLAASRRPLEPSLNYSEGRTAWGAWLRSAGTGLQNA